LYRRVAQYRAVVANDNRDFAHSDIEPIQEGLGRLIHIQIDINVRMAVAGKELPKAERFSRVARSHQDGVALTPIDQDESTQNESPHKNFAEFTISGD
jgi:hypothetical protein